MVKKELQSKNVNIKISPELLEETKEYLGVGLEMSKVLRKYLRECIDKKKQKNSPFKYCYCCEKFKNEMSEMNLTYGVKENEDEGPRFVFVCDPCLEEAITLTPEEHRERVDDEGTEEKVFRQYFRSMLVRGMLSKDIVNKDLELNTEVLAMVKRMKEFDNFQEELTKMSELYPTLYKLQRGKFIEKKKQEEYEKHFKDAQGDRLYDKVIFRPYIY